MKKEDIPILNQMMKSLEEAASKLERCYERKDYNKFNETKKFIMQIQKTISGMLK